MTKGIFKELNDHLEENEVKSIEFHISQVRLNKITVGEWINLENTKLKVILLNSSNYSEGIFELHQNYIDIHITIKGEDSFYIGENKDAELSTSYSKEFDYALYKTTIKEHFKIAEGSFVLIMPKVLHINQFKNNATTKLVVKKRL